MFGNPVAQAFIRPAGSPPILGDFRVTASFGQIDSFHPAPGHGGVDIGNGQCGEPLLAMATGVITLAEYLDSPLGPKTALTVRGIGDAIPDFEWAIAHCASLSVAVGDRVTRGQTIGVLGKSGTTACHAHLGCKQKVNGVWVSIDIWPLLDQNEDLVTTISQTPIAPTKWFTKGGSLTGYKLGAPSKTAIFPVGSSASTNAIVTGIDPLPAGWPAAPFLQVVNGGLAGYLIEQGAVTFTAPDPCAPVQAALAQSQKQLAAANARLAGIAKLATG